MLFTVFVLFLKKKDILKSKPIAKYETKTTITILLIQTTCGVISAQDLSSNRAAEALPLVGRPSVAGQYLDSDSPPLIVRAVSGFVFESRGHANGVNAIKGDVNNDKKVDISDIVAIINTMAGTASYSNADLSF